MYQGCKMIAHLDTCNAIRVAKCSVVCCVFAYTGANTMCTCMRIDNVMH